MSPSKPSATARAAFLGLGGNQGDPAARLAEALRRLDRIPGIRVTAVSSAYATAPVGPQDQPEFLNAVAAVRTTLGPGALLAACLRVEAALGRVRAERWGPRTIDIDLLIYGDTSCTEPGLTLPHPRLTERAFVLQPLAELAPEEQVAGRTIAAWAAAAGSAGVRRLAIPRLWPLQS
jgi:2-amino-4-hydroxy-6-hydroxymethyldihydropteridine diphosphokinase